MNLDEEKRWEDARDIMAEMKKTTIDKIIPQDMYPGIHFLDHYLYTLLERYMFQDNFITIRQTSMPSVVTLYLINSQKKDTVDISTKRFLDSYTDHMGFYDWDYWKGSRKPILKLSVEKTGSSVYMLIGRLKLFHPPHWFQAGFLAGSPIKLFDFLDELVKQHGIDSDELLLGDYS